MGPVTIGVDIGKLEDPTAICVAEASAYRPQHDWVSYLQRLPLGRTYPEVITRIRAVVGAVARRTGSLPSI